MKINSRTGSSVTIDGKTFHGNSIFITGKGKVVVDGVEQDGDLVGPVSVTVNGDAESIDGSFTDVTVTGSAGSVKTMAGDVKCGDVRGNVHTMSGDITCGKVGGSVTTMSGDVNHK